MGIEQNEVISVPGIPVFNWREWIEDPGQLSAEAASILDTLNELVNESDGEEFRRDVYDLSTKVQNSALMSLVNYFRAQLTQEERTVLNGEIREAKNKIPFEYFDI